MVELKSQPVVPPTVWLVYSVAAAAAVMNRAKTVMVAVIRGDMACEMSMKGCLDVMNLKEMCIFGFELIYIRLDEFSKGEMAINLFRFNLFVSIDKHF